MLDVIGLSLLIAKPVSERYKTHSAVAGTLSLVKALRRAISYNDLRSQSWLDGCVAVPSDAICAYLADPAQENGLDLTTRGSLDYANLTSRQEWP